MGFDDNDYNKLLTLSEEGDSLADRGQFEEAIKKYEQGLKLIPDPKEEWEASTWLFTAIGDAYFLNNDMPAALDHFLNAYKCTDGIGNAFINFRLGQIYFESGDESRAREFLLRTYMLDGDNLFQGEDDKYMNAIKHLI